MTVAKSGRNMTLELFPVRVTLKISEPSRRRSSRIGIVTVGGVAAFVLLNVRSVVTGV